MIEASEPPAPPVAAASQVSGGVPATGSGGAGACGVSTQVSCVKALVHFFWWRNIVGYSGILIRIHQAAAVPSQQYSYGGNYAGSHGQWQVWIVEGCCHSQP